MPLYQCVKCGCVENTATGLSIVLARTPSLFDWTDVEEIYKGEKLCSACAPAHYRDGTPSGYGKWHNKFRRDYLPKGMFTCVDYELVHSETKEPYAIWVKRTGWDITNEDKQ